MIGRLVHSADFQRLLSSPAWSRSPHFAVHHLPKVPMRPKQAVDRALEPKLSTGEVYKSPEPVDDLGGRFWLGAVLPKRLARRAVTRNLLRRQIREAFGRRVGDLPGSLPGGLWVVRLRSAFVRTTFVSPASDALRLAAREELDAALDPARHRSDTVRRAARRRPL